MLFLSGVNCFAGAFGLWYHVGADGPPSKSTRTLFHCIGGSHETLDGFFGLSGCGNRDFAECAGR
jgi:hypothetical protein